MATHRSGGSGRGPFGDEGPPEAARGPGVIARAAQWWAAVAAAIWDEESRMVAAERRRNAQELRDEAAARGEAEVASYFTGIRDIARDIIRDGWSVGPRGGRPLEDVRSDLQDGQHPTGRRGGGLLRLPGRR